MIDSEDLRYEFHDNFVPVGLSAGDAAASSETDESIYLFGIMSDTFNKLITNTYAFAEAKKSDSETKYDDNEGSPACIDNKDH